MKSFIFYIWQLPQNIIGLAVLLIHYICGHRPKKVTSHGITVYFCKHVNNCGVSLGNYILLDSDVWHTSLTYKHEHGHQLQSLYLGWLYLFVIGIPSGIHNLVNRNTKCNYYHFYTERWADRLGGIGCRY